MGWRILSLGNWASDKAIYDFRFTIDYLKTKLLTAKYAKGGKKTLKRRVREGIAENAEKAFTTEAPRHRERLFTTESQGHREHRF